ncbi:hypothetical protein NDU88_001159 [Pleurodeles waltl]|uniref:Uncharacterized protein n=1 Tax=Pleurodeles waltl TaxID=8319 RepID=A0AAV7WMS0_PLEWA|nr:hypothetical protein NDU88_001159 [Pleurodeles waltl]
MQGLSGPESGDGIDASLPCREKKQCMPTQLKEKRRKINIFYFSKPVLCHFVVFPLRYCVCWYKYFTPTTLKLSLTTCDKRPRG